MKRYAEVIDPECNEIMYRVETGTSEFLNAVLWLIKWIAIGAGSLVALYWLWTAPPIFLVIFWLISRKQDRVTYAHDLRPASVPVPRQVVVYSPVIAVEPVAAPKNELYHADKPWPGRY